MHKRFLATAVLAVAILFSQGGNFLIASLCPHFGSARASCEAQAPEPVDVSHEHMDHMQVESMQTESTSEAPTDGDALIPVPQSCLHCAVHSRRSPDASTIRVTEAAKRAGQLTPPLAVSDVVTVPQSFVPILSARAHGPPGEQPPRHILISIFRI